jgi:hypothetical protein
LVSGMAVTAHPFSTAFVVRSLQKKHSEENTRGVSQRSSLRYLK